jgi:ubiquinone/menaquinone biosynthesis C-methylase UbiE
MTKRQLNYFDILEAKKACAEGKNITELLRSQKNVAGNTSEIIEVAYDLQAGTYIEYVEKNPKQAALYARELASILDTYISPQASMLDIGTGELTTLSLLTKTLINKPKNIFAFDISWSRIYKGLAYARKTMSTDYERLTPFVGDISEIPLLDKTINITTSSHALEPNGDKLKELMAELFRITIDKLVLFEPCYEINTDEGKKRMDRLGYIKNIEGVAKELGGKLIEKIKIQNTSNPLNPTVCFVIKPPSMLNHGSANEKIGKDIFAVPGTNRPLKALDDFYFSSDTGLCFPTIKSIPILKLNAAILASALCD